MKTRSINLLFLTFSAWSLAGSAVFAQPALERLEREIRQRSETPEEGKSGYLGLLADDQKDRGRGVRVLEVYPNSPAAKAGFQKQDLITSLGGVRIRQMTDLSDLLDTFPPEKKVEFELQRDGKPLKVQVTMGRRTGAANTVPNVPETIPPPRGEAIPPPPEPEVVSRPPPEKAASSADSSPTGASRIEELQRKVDALEARVAELERRLAEVQKKDRNP
jgi:membrane-associated protease RseP (regulator of RpoE activity)